MKADSFDVEFVNPFLEGTIRTLEEQCHVKVTAMRPCLKADSPKFPVEIAGVIGVTSIGFIGTLSLCFTAQTFLNIMSQMFGTSFDKIDDDIEDGAGEILNIIIGYAESILETKGIMLERAVPTIVKGDEIEIKYLSFRPTITVPFETRFGSFKLDISIERGALPRNARQL